MHERLKISIDSNGIIPVFDIIRKRTPSIIQIVLSLTILFLGILVLSSVKMVYSIPYTDIDVVTANNMITNGSYPNLIVLDVRTQSEYDEGHLEDAILIPVTELESRIDELSQYKDSEIVVYCRTGVRSAQASSILDSNDFTKVFNVLGGITAWESAGYPIIPEFPSWVIIPIFVTTTLFALIIKKRLFHPRLLV